MQGSFGDAPGVFCIDFGSIFQTISKPFPDHPRRSLAPFWGHFLFLFCIKNSMEFNIVFGPLWTPLGPFYTPFPDHFQTISGPWTLPWWFLGHPWDPRRLGDVSGVPPGIFREASELHFGIIFYSFFASKIQWNLMLFLGFLQGSFWTSFCLPFSLENGIHFLCDFSQHRLCFWGCFQRPQ